jgi:hypothetical protein
MVSWRDTKLIVRVKRHLVKVGYEHNLVMFFSIGSSKRYYRSEQKILGSNPARVKGF